MTHTQLVSTLLFSLTLSVATTASATELQRIVSSVEYQFSDLDTPATGRMHALEKARAQAINLSESDYSIKTKFTGDGGVDEETEFSVGHIVRENVLSEEVADCTTPNLEGQICYHIQLEAMIDAGYISPSSEQLEESEKALRLAEELLSQ
ncbi:hypothetical protein [Shewanella sp. GD03713]|uniref:hypothetical protein n=1 Tax=Shewanella TaxID=22 RepID=UPI0024483636|nr:hypothetical protein [Shewanella sp. GD03713]MDH1472425.1 hypothetical protein [Shewanella sp. GD03713]